MNVVCLVSRGNANVAALTYEAPEDAAVGDSGSVPMWERQVNKEVRYPAVIISTDSAYRGPVKRFDRTHTASTREDIIAALALIGR